MKHTVMIFVLAILFSASFAQSPQFAVVRPDGTTYICPTFDSAYNKSADDDFIYLPGIIISGDKTISKKLTLIGTGHYPDSTVYTGKTKFTGTVYLGKRCTMEGIDVTSTIAINNPAANGCSFLRVRCGNLYFAGTNDHLIDGSVFYVISGSDFTTGSCTPSLNIFIKNSIITILQIIQNSSVKNCLLLGYDFGNTYLTTANTVFTNCIFKGFFQFDPSGYGSCFVINSNSSNNCIWMNATPPAPGNNNYENHAIDTIMINAPNNQGFSYSYNYHLKPNSPYLTAADDGGQIGIYGGAGPYKEGAVPSNPHIYFKQVATQSNNSGQLQINVKVRTNN
jgi:hypothetical protein